MLQNISKAVSVIKFNAFLSAEKVLHQQLRTTYVLKRRHQPYLHKPGFSPKRLRSRHYIYDLVKDTVTDKLPPLSVILTSYVEGVGDVGDLVSVKYNYAYNSLLLPGLAVYPTPENVEHYKNYEKKSGEVLHSSPHAQMTADALSRMVLSVVMNKEVPWTVQPWHVKTCFRKCGYYVPEESISLPSKPIKGPDMELQNKEFYITVTINNLEKANVICRIHHWSTVPAERIAHVHDFWKSPSEPIFQEDAPVIASIREKYHNKLP